MPCKTTEKEVGAKVLIILNIPFTTQLVLL